MLLVYIYLLSLYIQCTIPYFSELYTKEARRYCVVFDYHAISRVLTMFARGIVQPQKRSLAVLKLNLSQSGG